MRVKPVIIYCDMIRKRLTPEQMATVRVSFFPKEWHTGGWSGGSEQNGGHFTAEEAQNKRL